MKENWGGIFYFIRHQLQLGRKVPWRWQNFGIRVVEKLYDDGRAVASPKLLSCMRNPTKQDRKEYELLKDYYESRSPWDEGAARYPSYEEVAVSTKSDCTNEMIKFKEEVKAIDNLFRGIRV